MAQKRLRIWCDAEGDYLEVIFDQKPGYFRETASDQVMEKPTNVPGSARGRPRSGQDRTD